MDAIHILLQAFFQLVLSNSMGLVYTLKEILPLADMVESTNFITGRCLLWLGFAISETTFELFFPTRLVYCHYSQRAFIRIAVIGMEAVTGITRRLG